MASAGGARAPPLAIGSHPDGGNQPAPASLSIEYRRQSTEGYTHDGRLFGRGACDQELDDNRNTRHKIYTGSGHQDDVKPYVLCSDGLY